MAWQILARVSLHSMHAHIPEELAKDGVLHHSFEELKRKIKKVEQMILNDMHILFNPKTKQQIQFKIHISYASLTFA